MQGKLGVYLNYKNSDIEWLGAIPVEWPILRLKFAVDNYNLKAQPALDAVYIGLENVSSWTGQYVPVEGGNAEGTSNRFRPNNVLFGKLRPYLAKALITNGSGCCSSEFLVLAGKHVLPEYLLQYLLTKEFITEVNSSTYGAKMPRASWEFIANLPIPIPSQSEQEKVVAFLKHETSKIDALVTKQQQLIKLLQEKRQAVISHAVTKGLEPGVPMKDSKVEMLGNIPENWKVTPLMHLTPNDRPIMYGIVLPGPNVDEGVPIVKGGDVTPDRLCLSRLNKTTFEIESKYARSRLRHGDLVYSIRGSIGEAELVPPEIEGANLTQDAARISPRKGVDKRWLLYAMKSSPVFAQLDASATGATIRGINIKELKRASIPVPPSIEQIEIADYLDRKLEQFDLAILRAKTYIEITRERRSAIISAAVTGKVDVRDWQPPKDRLEVVGTAHG